MEVLRQIHFQALEPPMIEALIELIDRDLGYHLYAPIEQVNARFRSPPRLAFGSAKDR
jgi:hypothetical protein